MESKKVHFAIVENWRVVRTYERNFKTLSHFYTHIKSISDSHLMIIKTHDDDFYIFMYREEEDG